MIELPEALTLARQLNEAVAGRRVESVLPPSKPHKFCWFSGDPADYSAALAGSSIVSAEGFGIYVELLFDNGRRISVNDGVNIRLVSAGSVPASYQLLMRLDDGSALVFTVAMYGGIILHDGGYDNEYYLKSRGWFDPSAPEFPEQFGRVLAASSPKLSAKAFLATEQRFPGVGNGVIQDVLLRARVHPKRKLRSLDESGLERLRVCLADTLAEMTSLGGRDTERDLYGQPGGFTTRMSKSGAASGCPICGGEIVKETYLGGSVYFCPECQRLPD